MKKAITVLLLILTLALCICFTGCKRVKDDEAKEIVCTLVKESYDLNVIYFGQGLKHDKSAEGKNGYIRVDDDALYTERKPLIAKTREIFSNSYAQSIINSTFYGTTGGIDGTANFARYISDDDGRLTIKKDSAILDTPVAVYDYSSIEIVKNSKNMIIARLNTTNLGSNNTQVQITLVYEEYEGESAWRIDSATY